MSEYRYCVRGEIDIATAAEFRADLQRAVTESNAHVLIDCTFLTFIDSTGIAVLLEANRALEAEGRHMLIANVPSGPRRALEILGLSDLMRYDRRAS